MGDMGEKKMKKIRLFVSVELSGEVRKEISKFLRKINRSHFPVRWVSVENIHITLAFLGWQKQKWEVRSEKQEVKAVDLIVDCLEKAIEWISPFEVKIRGIGCFPDERRPRVVWLGLAGDLKSLAWLQKRVLRELSRGAGSRFAGGKVGFKMEERKFIPHLTLGRVNKGTKTPALHNLGFQLGKMKVGEFGSRIWVDGVSVMESVLKREGPEYRELANVKAQGPKLKTTT